MAVIYATMLAFDPLNAERDIKKIEPYVEGYQLDIMDNHFVPNISYGSDFINAVTEITYKKIWIHLMVDDPITWTARLKVQPNSIVTFHIEATQQIASTINYIKEKKWQASIAINPETNVEKVFPFLAQLDQVSLMAVTPGFPGQQFIEETLEKLHKLRGYRQTSGLNFRIAIDGGIKRHNIEKIVELGVDDLAIASGIFNAPDPIEEIKALNKLKDQAKVRNTI